MFLPVLKWGAGWAKDVEKKISSRENPKEEIILRAENHQ